ncbi:MAG TPA: class I SAM-dependent methyltransferase [Candidatus Sumerlaeota bacterium]|nr:class I SAM-dependent methyltransferase [Candidatus Sumerlaeota bacterium]HPS00918.1 class I SAM-dependent methyltransferase [Candidatus Sumerlaeota bacterium]
MRHYREIYRTDQLPVLQNRMFSSEQEALACPKGDIHLVQDMRTGLIFNSAFDPSLIDYGPDYQNEQACSSIFRGHLEEVAAIIYRHLHGKTLIEVGCGKGYFLEHLSGLGFDVRGFDPTYEGENPRISKRFFTPDLNLCADAIVLRHVLEHIQDPVDFLSMICKANGGRGKIYIEVPCFDWISEHRAWFDVFYEHVNYFRLLDFQNMFGEILEMGHVFGGQYLYVVAELASLRSPEWREEDCPALPHDFLGGIGSCAEKLKVLGKNHSAIWGGASKGVIFSLFMQRAGARIDLVIDINPAKQGKFIAGSGLRVCSPEEGTRMLESGATVFVMNSNYLEEIKALTRNNFNYQEIDCGNI